MTHGNQEHIEISKQHDHQVVYVDVGKLKPYSNNVKKHPQKQIHQIAASIRQFGFISPVIIDEKHEIIAGHGRWEAAKLLGLKTVPVISIGNLTPAEIKAYRIADNQLTLNTGYDDSLLKIEIKELIDLVEFELEIIGFETAEIDLIIDDSKPVKADLADDAPVPVIDKPAITRSGDTWIIGNHRLYCGNSLDDISYQMLMGGERAQLIFTDPPYNVPIDGHATGNGIIRHREFAMASGEMTQDEFTTFLANVSKRLIAWSEDGSIHYQCMDWRHMQEILKAGQIAGYELKNLCVWAKDNGGMGSLYRSQHELVFVFKNGAQPHINNIQLGKYGRYRTNVWKYAGVNTMRKGRMDDLEMHPTVKPVAMVADAIQDCSKRNGIVLDPFGGSGTTLIAAEKAGRHARIIEIDPHYCDVIIRRWQSLTGLQACHAETGRTFTQTVQEANNDR
jgi:DNA modification methylase